MPQGGDDACIKHFFEKDDSFKDEVKHQLQDTMSYFKTLVSRFIYRRARRIIYGFIDIYRSSF